MERSSVFQGVPINEDYDINVDAPDAIPHTALAPAWVKPPPGPLAVKVIKIVAMIHGNGLTVAEFLDAFSWGDRDCTLDATLSAARVALWKSHQLPGILQRWHKPPRPKNSKKGHAKAARSVMEDFALKCAQEIFERELESLADIFASPAGDDIKEESLTSISFPEMVKLVKTKVGKSLGNKLFAIYFEFRDLSAKGFDTLHAISLTMSNKWTGDAVDRISAEGMEAMKLLMDSALTRARREAGPVYIKRSAKPLPKEINRMLQEFRREGMKNPLTAKDIFRISRLADGRRTPHVIFLILDCLFGSPEFDFSAYSEARPDSTIPCGKDEITLQYLLGTLNIPEASYEDNARLIIEWLKQLDYSAPDAQKKLGLEQPPKQHLGTAKGRGLSAAFDILKRRGLQIAQTQGTFFHDLNETLHIIAEAQIRELWLQVGKTKNLVDLQKTPNDLYKLAEQIFSDHASSAALVRMGLKKDQADEVKAQSVMFLWDVLPYILLRSAVKHGDVGFMEDMIPFMLFRFIGGKNNNYTGEMLELFQGLHREWPPEICDFVRDNCWVINNTGRFAGFKAVDEAQEMNIKDIKVTYRSEGPNVDWEYLKKLHPAIHVIRAVNSHMEFGFKTRIRGQKHTVPKKEEDIRELQKWYRASMVHAFKPGRKFHSKLKTNPDQPKDTLTRGSVSIQTGKTLQNWVEIRTVERATTEDWDDLLSGESDQE
ncbi:hypothetical protein B0H13DRAFT_1864904 [Mycena leptocephala]|nr:hypothetical protein B0H13DRAFT_1864904 [Mycena leptocephala]